MKRRQMISVLILIGSVLLLLKISYGYGKDTQNGKHYQELQISSETWREIVRSRENHEESLFDSISFDGYKLSCNSTNQEWFYSLIEGSETADNPLVSVQGYGGAVNIAFWDDELDDEQMIARDGQIPFVVYTETEYQIGYIVVTTLPILEITMEGDETEIGMDDTKISMRLFDNRDGLLASQRVITSDADAHIRGASTIYYDKKSYKLSLTQESLGNNTRQNKISLLGMREDDDWILYAGMTDGERVRNLFSTELWYNTSLTEDDHGFINGDGGEYVEVFINGEYWGLYVLMYPIDEKQLELNETGDPATTDYFYRGITAEATTEEMLMEQYTSLVIGGFEYRGPGDEVATYEQWKPLGDFLAMMASDDEEFLATYDDYVDRQNVYDIWLFVKFAQAVDNHGKNTNYIAKYDEETGKYTILFSPWDLDRTWGYGAGMNDANTLMDTKCFGITRLISLGDEQTVKELKERYRELRETVWSEDAILEMLEGYYVKIWDSGAMQREMKKWPASGLEAFNDSQMRDFKEYVLTQIEFMDEYMENLE